MNENPDHGKLNGLARSDSIPGQFVRQRPLSFSAQATSLRTPLSRAAQNKRGGSLSHPAKHLRQPTGFLLLRNTWQQSAQKAAPPAESECFLQEPY